ncbi:MAG: Bax inhibitor-1/YccA family protein [Victivallales bacterium]|nr:Bax inhibitor-1/YccA family protein [Victivallales bacterium]
MVYDFRNNSRVTTTAETVDAGVNENAFITRVYGWMCVALAITGLVALYVVTTPVLINTIATNQMLLFGLIIVELAAVGALVLLVNKMPATLAAIVFVTYSALNGVTLSTLFLIYTASSIASAFFITSATFAAMSCYGWYTKRDLSSIGNLCFMGLLGIIIASLVNMFLQSSGLYWAISYIGVLIFVGLIAYDTQKIKRMSRSIESNSETGKKTALLGALALYLDFINLFIMLLRILGSRR